MRHQRCNAACRCDATRCAEEVKEDVIIITVFWSESGWLGGFYREKEDCFVRLIVKSFFSFLRKLLYRCWSCIIHKFVDIIFARITANKNSIFPPLNIIKLETRITLDIRTEEIRNCFSNRLLQLKLHVCTKLARSELCRGQLFFSIHRKK